MGFAVQGTSLDCLLNAEARLQARLISGLVVPLPLAG